MVAIGLAGLLAALVVVPSARAQDPKAQPVAGAAVEGHAHDRTNIWTIARGGQLYDKWWAVTEAEPPKTTHPAYPSAGKKKGSTTWRCKECHGWDYKGKDGAYAKGSHFTGLKGVRGVAGLAPQQIYKIIMNKTHGFTPRQMPHSVVEKLALFLSYGQIDMNKYIDPKAKTARGNIKRGAAFYQTVCAVCHVFDGRLINFGSDKKPQYVGTVGRKNTWEDLHKIRFGQPGVAMVALAVLEVQDQVDILAYIQTLPAK